MQLIGFMWEPLSLLSEFCKSLFDSWIASFSGGCYSCHLLPQKLIIHFPSFPMTHLTPTILSQMVEPLLCLLVVTLYDTLEIF